MVQEWLLGNSINKKRKLANPTVVTDPVCFAR
jgi:hypothetical protein